MATTTYYVALAFTRSEDGDIVACEPKEARSSSQAIRMAELSGDDGGTLRRHRLLAHRRSGDGGLRRCGDLEDDRRGR